MTKEKKRSSALTGVILSVVLLALVVFLENSGLVPPTHILFTVLKKGAVYSLVAVSMNLLNGFTGLFSLGQAGFMLLGAYSYAILTIPVAKRAGVYQYFDGGWVQFSLPEAFSGVLGDTVGSVIGMLLALLVGGVLAALVAYLIGLCEEVIKGLGYTTFSDAFTFALLIVVLCVKPTGLFGEKVTDKV